MALKKLLSVLLVLLFIAQSLMAQSKKDTEIKKVINTFFEGLHTSDTLKIKETTVGFVLMQTIGTGKDGKQVLQNLDFSDFLKNIASINPKTTKIQEQLLSFEIKADEYMANVWTPYKFYVNGEFSHCGVNSFQLFKDDGSWKIFYIIDTRRKQNCNG